MREKRAPDAVQAVAIKAAAKGLSDDELQRELNALKQYPMMLDQHDAVVPVRRLLAAELKSRNGQRGRGR